MTAPTLTSAVSSSFPWVSRGVHADVVLTFPSGPDCDATVSTGTYWAYLSPQNYDFLWVVESAINARMAALGRSEFFSLTLGSNGKATLSCTGGVFSVSATYPALAELGFVPPVGFTDSLAAVYQPAHICYFVERVSPDWSPQLAAAGATTLYGYSPGIYSGVYREEDEILFGYIPRNPVTASDLQLNQTPWMPDPGYSPLSASFPRPWTVLETLLECGGRAIYMSLGNFQKILADPSLITPFYSVSLPFPEIGAPRKERVREGWDAYFKWTAKWVRIVYSNPTRSPV